LRPTGCALLAELFDSSKLGFANGIFSLGVYIGYGLAYILGNYIPDADILGYGWRPAYFIGCFLGVPIGIALFFVKDPK
jgi:MFS family permease